MRTLMLLIAISVVLTGCGANAEPGKTAEPTQTLPAGHPQIGDAGDETSSAGLTLTGKVSETLEGGGYTYIRLTTDSGETWVAVPKAPVEIGSEITVSIQMTMTDFESPSLDRKFDSLVFATMGSGSGAVSPHGMSGMGMGHGGGKPEVDLGAISVEKAAGANAKTVAEIWAQRAELKDSSVVVRGKVVKFLPTIMGRNGVHLRDGSGSEGTGDNDLTVTTDATVTVGDVVVATGIVSVDKELGAGYAYPVILEEGKFTK
jgi:hypothetical protein